MSHKMRAAVKSQAVARHYGIAALDYDNGTRPSP
jgi:hypothetical protein